MYMHCGEETKNQVFFQEALRGIVTMVQVIKIDCDRIVRNWIFLPRALRIGITRRTQISGRYVID